MRYRQETRAARERIESLGSQLVETSCAPIEYARVGNGYPVLIVHGAMGGFDQGLMLANLLPDSGFQLISISRFGYLRSPMPANASVSLQADAFASLLDALDIPQAAVFAISAGATSAIRFATRHPERLSSLILLSPAAPGKVKAATPPRAVFDTLLRNDFAYWALMTYFGSSMHAMIGVPKGFVLTPQLKAEANRTLAEVLPSTKRIDGMIFDSYLSTSDFYEEISDASPYSLNSIAAPVLLINALDDPLAIPENVRAMAQKIPNADLFVVPDGGHMLLGHAEEVKSKIAQFLRTNIGDAKNSQ
jgi:pimeloyl-ACP methyl ester carboxylesterase